MAAQNGFDAIVRRLVTHGANVNQQEEDGFAPLHVSCQNGHYGVVDILLGAQADPNLMARWGTVK